jgi:hypothetical protein
VSSLFVLPFVLLLSFVCFVLEAFCLLLRMPANLQLLWRRWRALHLARSLAYSWRHDRPSARHKQTQAPHAKPCRKHPGPCDCPRTE